MMNVAAQQSAPLPNHFAPPARTPSTRRQLYHHPTLHMRAGSNSSPRHSAHEFVPSSSPLPPQYSSAAAQQPFKRPVSSQPSPPLAPIPGSYPTHVHSQPPQQKQPLQRQPTAGSSNSLNQYIHPGPPLLSGHRRQTASTSTSASSIARIPSSQGQYPSSTSPMIQARPNSMSPADTYVARLRRAKATVWSARGQREDLDRSNSKEDKYNKKYVQSKQRTSTSKNKLSSSGPMYAYEIGLPAHPRQLMPRLSANEAEDSDYMDPFMSGPNFFDSTGTAAAPSTKGSVKTKTTTSSTSPSASAQNVPLMLTPSNDTSTRDNETKSSASIEDGRGSPDPMQSYYKPIVRGQSKRIARAGEDDVKDRQVGERRLFVVNASPSESEED